MVENKIINVLCFFDSDQGRDPEILLPLIYFAEQYQNCSFNYAVTWDIHEIYKQKPNVVLIANTIGSKLHFQISRYAFNSGIKVFALISEGNFRTNGTFKYWGYNLDKKFYQEKVCLWSQRTFDFLKKEIPAERNKMVFTGATGFDRYKIYKFLSKDDFFIKYNLKPYKKVIGYAGWAFGKLFNEQGRKELTYFHKDNPDRLKWVENQMYAVESILKEAVENNPDILFILKRHPSEANQSIVSKGMNEMMRLADFENVLYVDKNVGINDLLSVSDIWTGFETTTTLEYWLLKGGPTILLNTEPDFKRDKLHKGSLISLSAKDFQVKIDEYYSAGKIEEFNAPGLKELRTKLIMETIGFDDGLNHLRAGYYFSRMINSLNDQSIKVEFHFRYYIKHWLLKIGRILFVESIFLKIPKVKKHVWIFKLGKFEKLFALKNRYKEYLDKFYKKNKFTDKIKTGQLWKDLGLE